MDSARLLIASDRLLIRLPLLCLGSQSDLGSGSGPGSRSGSGSGSESGVQSGLPSLESFSGSSGTSLM